MKFKSTVAQAAFDEAMELIEKSEKDLRKLFHGCKDLNEHVGILGIIADKRLNGYLAIVEVASRIEMQCASMVARVSANVTGESK